MQVLGLASRGVDVSVVTDAIMPLSADAGKEALAEMEAARRFR